MSCPKGTYLRRGYTRHDGRVAYKILPACSAYPASNSWVEFLREHGGQGYTRKELQRMYRASKGRKSQGRRKRR